MWWHTVIENSVGLRWDSGICCLLSGVEIRALLPTRKAQYNQALNEQCFTYIEKRHSKISFSSGRWSPMASGSFLAADTVQLALLWCDRRTLFPPCRGRIYHWGWPGAFWHTWLSWTKDCTLRASLVAQWLRIRLPMQGTRVQALVWEDPTCRGAAGPVSHNYWSCATGACAPQ